MRLFFLWSFLHAIFVMGVLLLFSDWFVFLAGMLLPYLSFLYMKKEELLLVLHRVSHFYYFPLLIIALGFLYNYISLIMLGMGWLFHVYFERKNKGQSF